MMERVRAYPQILFMGSKHRLLPWLHEILGQVEFDTVLDAFSGSGCVAYLFKSMGKEVTTNDFLHFASLISRALIENSGQILRPQDVERLLAEPERHESFIEDTFTGIFFTPEDLRFLDRIWANLRKSRNPYRKAVCLAALIRSCVKRQPRGVFTVAGDPEHYKDGRRDLKLSLGEHFLEQVEVYNRSVFDNGRKNRSLQGDVFEIEPDGFDIISEPLRRQPIGRPGVPDPRSLTLITRTACPAPDSAFLEDTDRANLLRRIFNRRRPAGCGRGLPRR